MSSHVLLSVSVVLAFTFIIVMTTIPSLHTTIVEALEHEGWHNAMDEEINTIKKSHIWNLVPFFPYMNLLGVQS